MPNTVPARAPLGASTTNRKWYLDVIDPDGTPGVWIGVFGIQEMKPRPSEPTTQDDSDMDGEGWKSNAVTALTWGADGKVLRKLNAANAQAYDPGQEVIRKAGRKVGNVLHVRYYEMEPNGPRIEAYEGDVTVTWTPDGGNMESLDTAAFSLTGRGKPTLITHPEGVTATPIITSATPGSLAAAGVLVITGYNFDPAQSGTAAYVKIGGTNATSFVIISPTVIRAVLPAGSAGSAPVTVGTSAAFPYTRT